jgi:signal transduction histidine kinase
MPGSLRVRFLIASLMWTLGLLALAHLLSMVVIQRHTWLIRVDHHLLALIGVVMAAAGLWQVRRGFLPFRELRSRLASVREGRSRRVEGRYPSEVQPLVSELNALLDDRERRVDQALAKAGDLAHGLKTPLAVLSQEAERAESASQHEIAATLTQQVERMRRQIDYHLAHARAAVSGATPGVRCSVAASVEGLVRTLERLYEHRRLSITADVSPDHSVRGRREDLDEMLGNLLDNACKWASSQVMVSSSMENGSVIVTVDDDGGGIDPSMRDVVLQRGVRADEAAPGSGFGLAIVRDLAELYGGSVVLESSPAGGVRARLRLPKGETS